MRLTKLRVDGWINKVGILIVNNNFINYDGIADAQRKGANEFDDLYNYLNPRQLANKNDFPIIELAESYWANYTCLRFYNDLTAKYVQEVVLSDCYETPQSLFDITYNREFKFQDIALEMDDEHFYFLIEKLSKVNRVFDLPEGFNVEDIKFLKTRLTINECKIVYDAYVPFLNGIKLEPKEYKDPYNLVKLIPR